MQTEIEAKFLDTNHQTIRDKLQKLGGTCVQTRRLMRRKNFDYDDDRLGKISGWVRLRDEGDKVTLAYKQLNNRNLDGTKEVSVTVSSFEDTEQFLLAIGLQIKSHQQTWRESWQLNGVEIELDEWPWIKPFIEVEAKTESALYETVKQLGLDMAKAVHGSVEIAYQAEFDVTEDEVDAWPEIIFGDVPAAVAAKKRTT